MNNSKVDANATPIVLPSSAVTWWNLLNVGLTKSEFSGDKAEAVLGSNIQIY